MSYREKSAWLMILLLGAAGLYYLHTLLDASAASGKAPPASIVFGLVIVVVIGSIIAQVALAVTSPKEANAAADERERLVQHRSSSWSGLLLAGGVIVALGHFIVHSDGDMLFHLIVGSLILAQVAEYAFQIAFLRRCY